MSRAECSLWITQISILCNNAHDKLSNLHGHKSKLLEKVQRNISIYHRSDISDSDKLSNFIQKLPTQEQKTKQGTFNWVVKFAALSQVKDPNP